MRSDLNTEKVKKLRKTYKTRILKFLRVFLIFPCSVESEVKKIVLVKLRLREVRFSPR